MGGLRAGCLCSRMHTNPAYTAATSAANTSRSAYQSAINSRSPTPRELIPARKAAWEALIAERVRIRREFINGELDAANGVVISATQAHRHPLC